MNTIYKSMIIVLVLIGLWIALACTGHCEVSCHPNQHTCMTDASCEDEEAYFLDLDELHQSDGEAINDGEPSPDNEVLDNTAIQGAE